MDIPSLQTVSLLLRPILPGDAAALYQIYQHEGVLQYFPNPSPPPLEKVERFVAYQQKHWDAQGYGNWAVVLRETGEYAGWAGLQFLPETGETEVGYLLDRPFWGRGFATEAAYAALRFGFVHFDFPEIIALVHPDNIGSLRVAAKCGLQGVERKVYWGIELVRHSVTRAAFLRDLRE